GLETNVLWEPNDEERERPEYWRFWRMLPARGKIGIFFGSWYTQPVVQYALGKIDGAEFERCMGRVRGFERMLAAEGFPVLKYYLHLSKKAERKQLKTLFADPATRWRVHENAKKFFKRYDDFRHAAEEQLRLTSMDFAPWTVVEAVDDEYRNMTVAKSLLRSLEVAADDAEARAKAGRPKISSASPRPKRRNVLRTLKMDRTLSGKQYDKRLVTAQADLGRLTRDLAAAGRSLLALFEGPDAAGKGGAIRRLTAAMSPYLYRVIGIAAPTDEERAHPYLWRFWRHLPRRGRVTIYDRSWYGRVLVERLEGFAKAEEWQRAYTEINDFEEQMAEGGIILMKFWIAITAEEQLQRFKERQHTPFKQYKITEEDWRNRKKWDGYEAAACDMIERTSTSAAPWTLVEGNNKRWARVKVAESVRDRLAAELAS
ncbi:MAG: polyphosphate:AMP phosphotransferase, partial [Gemmatimonadota bacterium]|nr:polyphosphate:AMP phosphotransferase [Gemmatimonadota bacterium]